MYFKEAILCLMFAAAESDGNMRDDELVSIVTMKEVFKGYSEADIVGLYREYKKRFSEKPNEEIAHIMSRQIPDELSLATLSLLADIIVLNFNVDVNEGSFITTAASAMGISDVAVKTILMTSLSKKLMMNTSRGDSPV